MSDNPNMEHVDEELDRKICALTHLTPNDQLDPNDVFIAGYMKSGNTWFQNLVVGVIYGLVSEHLPYSVVWELVPKHGLIKSYYRRYSTPMFFQTHNFPRPEYKRVVYLLRDGRDVVTSLRHHVEAKRGKEIEFLKLVKGQTAFPGHYKWHTHVEAWLANPYQAQMIIIKYEDLREDPIRELRRFCEFVGVERDDALLEQAAVNTSFERMRYKETRFGFSRGNWPKGKFFVRRGEVGSHKDEMPPEVLGVFLREAGDTLRKLGYL